MMKRIAAIALALASVGATQALLKAGENKGLQEQYKQLRRRISNACADRREG